MAEITLSNGMIALVDDADLPLLSGYRWNAYERQSVGSTRWYAARMRRYMHRVILDAQRGQYVDHINGNGLDNRRSNIRICSNRENCRNQSSVRGAVPYKGVHVHFDGRFRARIKIDGKHRHLGCFATAEEAARAYDTAALEHFGAFANPNFQEFPATGSGAPAGLMAAQEK